MSENIDIEQAMFALQNVSEYVQKVQMDYHSLAEQIIYEGNSVGWWHSKAKNYTHALDKAWEALNEIGIKADGQTTVAEAILKLKQEDKMIDLLKEIESISEHVSTDFDMKVCLSALHDRYIDSKEVEE